MTISVLYILAKLQKKIFGKSKQVRFTVVNGKEVDKACDLVAWSLHAVESEVSTDKDLL